jgi:hypothetical protein
MINILHNTSLAEKIKEEFEETVMPQSVENRGDIEKQWDENRALFEMRHDTNKVLTQSRFNPMAKLPTVPRAIKRMVRTVKRNVLPYTRPFEPQPIIPPDEPDNVRESITMGANRHAQLLEHQLFTQSNLRKRSSSIILQYFLYGVSVIKVIAKRKIDTEFIDGRMERILSVIPDFEPVDIYRWYVYPDKISDVSKSKYVFEWNVKRIATMDSMARAGFVNKLKLEEALDKDPYEEGISFMEKSGTTRNAYSVRASEEANRKAKIISARANRGAHEKIDPIDRKLLGRKGGYCIPFDGYYFEDVDITYKDRNGNTVHLEKDGMLETIHFTYMNNEIISMNLVKEHPYLIYRVDDLPNQFYQHGAVRHVQRLNILSEGILVQALENLEDASGRVERHDHRTGVKPAEKLNRITRIYAPQGAFEVFKTPDVSRSSSAMLALLESFSRESLGDTPPTASNVSARSRGSRTEGGMELLTMEAMQAILEDSMKFEEDILVPLVNRYSEINRQIQRNITVPLERGTVGELGTMGLGHETIIVRPEDIAISSTFKWLGSIRVVSETRLMENAMNFIALVSKLPPGEADIDMVRILRQAWSVAFGQKDAEQIIREPGMGKIPVEMIVQVMSMLVEKKLLTQKEATIILNLLQQVQMQQSQQGMGGGGGTTLKSMATQPLMERVNE